MALLFCCQLMTIAISTSLAGRDVPTKVSTPLDKISEPKFLNRLWRKLERPLEISQSLNLLVSRGEIKKRQTPNPNLDKPENLSAD